jgi:hypothetical protein
MVDPTTPEGLVGDPAAVTGTYQSLTGNTPAGTFIGTGSSVASNSDYVGDTNVALESERILEDPAGYLGEQGSLSARTPTIDANAPGTTINNNRFNLDTDGIQVDAAQAGVSQASQVTRPITAPTTQAVSTVSQVTDPTNQAQAQTRAVDPRAIIQEQTLDTQGLATGRNEDGSINETGEALNKFATLNMTNIIDTSTVSGKLLAQSLGEGNYTDSKATVLGQLEIISNAFTDPATGQPTIPPFAAGVARNVSRIAAFKGVTGTAATAAMTTALAEAMLPVAMEDAKFFQTVSLTNLNNKQQQVINTANVLSKFELANLDSRMSTAVNNAKTFINYDMANLENEQQAMVLNTQSRVQSILESAKEENVTRRFNTQTQVEVDQFYDKLGTQIDLFNQEQKNTMEKFNSGELNDIRQFNASLENQREQFYLDMQYQIDAANAAWRQNVTTANAEMTFQAAATDVKNIVNLTTEQLNQMWDRTDSLLEYSWREGENEKDRNVKIALAKMELEAAQRAADAERQGGMMGAIGSIGGAVLGQAAGAAFSSGGVLALASDARLKENIQQYGELFNGVKLYQWDWTEEAIERGFDVFPTYGVVAQEVQKTHPDAVIEGDDGYLRVKYEMITNDL